VLNVLGMFPGEPGPPGLECAGVVVAVGDGVTALAVGDRVMGIAPNAFDSHVTTDRLVVPIPPDLTFADAATVPIAFLTAAYGLRQLADLRPGERVLVHAAAGGVGQAAVQIALALGAEVHATVGSPEKRRYLEALGVRHVYGSRTLDFADELMAATGGAGVDVVLNSLSDDFVGRSFDVLAAGGRFLEIGKRGVWTPAEAQARRPDAAYHLYDLADFLAASADDVHASLGAVAAELASGALRPLALRAFPADAVEDAFRFMAQARHIGKVVVTHRPAAPLVRPDGGYLVTGGLGGIGLALARWLVEHGAGAVVLTGRRPPSPDAAALIAELVAAGGDVRVVTADVAVPAELARVLDEVRATGAALRGVFHAAGIVDDGAIGGQTAERLGAVLAPKLQAAELLDRATRTLDVDHFVLFSSASALLGAPGQSGYAAANAALDAVAHRRRSVGRPAISVDWGAWSDVGMAMRLDDRARERLAARGAGTLDPATALEALGSLLATTAPQVAVLPIDWPVLLATFPAGAAPPFLAEVADGATDGGDIERTDAPDVRAALAAAEPDDRRDVLDAFVHGQIVRVLGLDPDEAFDRLQGLTDIGMDSLMAVELSNRLRAGLDLPLPSTLAFEHPTFRALTDHLATELSGEAGPGRDAPRARAGRRSSDVDDVAALSDDEAAERLLRELEESGY
jgi:NADPH:quinone reductase-like Zn-dependent oxidoreductase/acyl carrier protein